MMANAARRKVIALQRQVAGLEARLSAVPKIRTFLESLHQKAVIEYVIYAECGEQDIVLLQAASSSGGTSSLVDWHGESRTRWAGSRYGGLIPPYGRSLR